MGNGTGSGHRGMGATRRSDGAGGRCTLFVVVVFALLTPTVPQPIVRWTGPASAQQPGGGQRSTADMRVMTFNIRYGTANDGDNAWPNRRELAAEVVRAFDPVVMGAQEALAFQLEELQEMLPGMGRIGVGRDDGVDAGEFSAIFYDTSRLEVLAEGTFWFSESPSQPGSTAWGATIPRICTWARFRDRSNGRTFFFYNNHWDHQSQESRERSASLLLDRIAAREPSTDAVIVTGDFNAGEANAAFELLVGGGAVVLSDTYRTLHPSETVVGTFNGFEGESGGDKIDAILTTRDWLVVSAGIDRTRDGARYPSDHFPVTAVLRWRTGARRAPRRRRAG